MFFYCFYRYIHKYLLTFHSAIGKCCVPLPLLMLVKFFYIWSLNIHQISIHFFIPSVNCFYRQVLWYVNHHYHHWIYRGFPGGTSGKELTCQCRGLKKMHVLSLGWEYTLEEGMAAHSSILVWGIPWTKEPNGL